MNHSYLCYISKQGQEHTLSARYQRQINQRCYELDPENYSLELFTNPINTTIDNRVVTMDHFYPSQIFYGQGQKHNMSGFQRQSYQ
jgi:hypothetical protein